MAVTERCSLCQRHGHLLGQPGRILGGLRQRREDAGPCSARDRPEIKVTLGQPSPAAQRTLGSPEARGRGRSPAGPGCRPASLRLTVHWWTCNRPGPQGHAAPVRVQVVDDREHQVGSRPANSGRQRPASAASAPSRCAPTAYLADASSRRSSFCPPPSAASRTSVTARSLRCGSSTQHRVNHRALTPRPWWCQCAGRAPCRGSDLQRAAVDVDVHLLAGSHRGPTVICRSRSRGHGPGRGGPSPAA